MEQKYRHELKFICSKTDLLLLENQIRFLCPPDPHVGQASSYQIRSVYFDTPESDAYYENENGENDRAKYRIRIYNQSDAVIKLERKSSLSGLKQKESCRLTRSQCDALLGGLDISFPDNTGLSPGKPQSSVNSLGETANLPPLLLSFLAERRNRLLQPKVTVDYDRAPYVHPIGNVRITFDRNIRSSHCTDLFEENLPLLPILPDGMELLEVKYNEVLPRALLDVLKAGHDLRRTSFSKYYLCRNGYQI